MNIVIAPGRYLIAVSGGVDSVVLLDLLHNLAGVDLVVAHFSHGIRSDSEDDLRFVAGLAERYKLKFVSETAQLGSNASEASSRTARYNFLWRVAHEHDAAIITAHHQGDAVETALLNIERGTGRKGLTALASGPELVRPLLEYSKPEIIDYAMQQNLEWVEDSTNYSTQYRRNYFRRRVIPKLTPKQLADFVQVLARQRIINAELDKILDAIVDDFDKPDMLPRDAVEQLGAPVATEVIATWLRRNNLAGFDTKMLERVVAAVHSAHTGKKVMLKKNAYLLVSKETLALMYLER